MSKFYLAFSLFVALVFTGCENKAKTTQNFWIDNPLDKEIVVTIDEVDYKLPAESGVSVILESGVHNLKYDGQQVKFLSKKCDQGVILNPTLSNYYLGYTAYFGDIDDDKKNEEMEKRAEAYLFDYEFEPGVVTKVPFKLANDLFIEQYEYYWNFGVTEPFSSVLTIDKQYEYLNTVVQSKLFREKDYAVFAKAILPEGFTFPKNNKKLSDEKPFVIVTEDLYPECPEKQYLIALVNDKFDSLKVAPIEQFNDILNRLQQLPYTTKDLDRGSFVYENPCEESYPKKNMAIVDRINTIGPRSAFVID